MDQIFKRLLTRLISKFVKKEKSFRFQSYYDLKDALKREGCPICTLVQEDSERSLYFLFYENANDVGIRMRLRASGGFCNWHLWLATQYNEHNLGIAIIYQDLLQAEIKRLEAYSSQARQGLLRRFFSKKPAQEEKPRARCFTCEVIGFLEQLYVETLLDSMTEEKFSEAYDQSQGICLPHLRLARRLGIDHPNLPLLIEHQQTKLKRLQSGGAREVALDLLQSQEGKLYHPWRSSRMFRPEDATNRLLYQLTESLVGKREVFPNDLSHGEEVVGV